jgi:calcineurin-like phosphoesterase family protein
MRIFVISDTHFGHKALAAEYLSRPENFTRKTIENWNRLVNKDDLIIHLGDVALGGPKIWEETVSILPGRKILVSGNHDKKNLSWYMANGFDFCCSSFNWNYFGVKIVFSHEPQFEGSFELNIHGHLHLNRHKEYETDQRHYLLALENSGYQPLLLETIVNEWKRSVSSINNKDELI